MEKYTIKPLKWKKNPNGSISAILPFGSYTVRKVITPGPSGETKYSWGYCFQEYHDECEYYCSTEAAGKAYAQRNWEKRIKSALKKVK